MLFFAVAFNSDKEQLVNLIDGRAITMEREMKKKQKLLKVFLQLIFDFSHLPLVLIALSIVIALPTIAIVKKITLTNVQN